MAAFGALLSLRHTIDQIQNHPRPPISLDNLQIKPLIEKVNFLLYFLHKHTNDALEERMAEAAYEAEDIIESRIADRVGKASITTNDDSLFRTLQKVIHDFDSIAKDATDIKEKAEKIEEGSSSSRTSSSRTSFSPSSKTSSSSSLMVGFDGVMNYVMDKLTGQNSGRQIYPICGMGGIGKTTLARNIYANPLIVQYFDVRGWATISQEYNSKEILLEVLLCLKSGDKLGQMSEEELGEKVYKCLFGRRYLIVMDDMWDIEAWDKVKPFFPENNNRSRVLMTTRLVKIGVQLNPQDFILMNFLDHNRSWNLLRRCVFREEECPPELEEIGKNIAKNCRGLPLSIVVIGGLLAKSERTSQHWQHVAENLSSIVSSEDGERCFKILQLSYNQLPIYLKPCFLYMGIFPEDHKIHVPTLIKLWVAEGFVSRVEGKSQSLETVARELCLHDLVLRNLVQIHTTGRTRKIKRCTIHDLLRDLCIKEVEKCKFLRTMETTGSLGLDLGQSWLAQRHIGIHQSTSEKEYIPRPLPEVVQSASRARTLTCNVDGALPSVIPFRLLRVLHSVDEFEFFDESSSSWSARPLEDIFHLVNSRHLAIVAKLPAREFPQSIYRLWNLRTLIINSDWNEHCNDRNWPVLDIWQMPQLVRVKVDMLKLTDPPTVEEENGSVVMYSLETLETVYNFTCGEEMVKKIPNIKKLGIDYEKIEDLSPNHGLNNLSWLRKLEVLSCSFLWPGVPRQSELARDLIAFPVSLKKLTLEGTRLGWEDMTTKIGPLPYLEALQLDIHSFVGPEWKTAEGGFRSLKYLGISNCWDLECWIAGPTHFPSLERLELMYLHELKEIPLGIGDLPRIRWIKIHDCSDSVVLSAKEILDEYEGLGNVGLEIEATLRLQTQLRGESLVG